jgi:hypothetical protein
MFFEMRDLAHRYLAGPAAAFQADVRVVKRKFGSVP